MDPGGRIRIQPDLFAMLNVYMAILEDGEIEYFALCKVNLKKNNLSLVKKLTNA